MTRPDPGAGSSDSAKGFAKAEEGWDRIRTWLRYYPQGWWSQMHTYIDQTKGARR